MAKQSIMVRISVTAFFLACVCLLMAACVFVRPDILNKIKIREQEMLRIKLKAVLPAFDNEPWKENFKVEDIVIYPARREEKVSLPGDLTGLPGHESQTVTANVLKGFAFQISSADSEGNDPVWVGLDMEGELTGFSPVRLRAARVPENLTQDIFLETSKGTSASRIILEAVNRGKEFFEMHKNFFYAQAHEAQSGGEAV